MPKPRPESDIKPSNSKGTVRDHRRRTTALYRYYTPRFHGVSAAGFATGRPGQAQTGSIDPVITKCRFDVELHGRDLFFGFTDMSYTSWSSMSRWVVFIMKLSVIAYSEISYSTQRGDALVGAIKQNSQKIVIPIVVDRSTLRRI